MIGIVLVICAAFVVILADTTFSIEKACYELCPLVNGSPVCSPCPKSFNVDLGIGGILLGLGGGIVVFWNKLAQG